MPIKRGDLYYADLSPVVGSEQGGVRPVLILQNNIGNKHSPTVIAAAVSASLGKPPLPTHVCLRRNRFGLFRDSVVMLEQLRTLDRSRLREYMGTLDAQSLRRIDQALAVSIGLAPVEAACRA
ncbi:MAG: type II toxin-antitoxin system PemK/MazF family toxin [Anaerotruncus sp.]|nr:type II toxin-antitoxin system PemK/MazF family toxin [Anaerotruncus sp.]